MKQKSLRIILPLLLLPSVFISRVSAQADLTLQNELTTEYIVYLGTKKATWEVEVLLGGDNATVNKAHLGLALLAFAWSHVDGDTMVNDLDPIMDDLITNLGDLAGQIDDHILPIMFAPGLDSMLSELTSFFSTGDYADFRDSVSQYLENIDGFLGDGLTGIENWLDDVDENFSDENFKTHIDAVRDRTADFQFGLQVIGSGYDDSLFVFDRTFFNRLDSMDVIGSAMGESFEYSIDLFDSIMADIDADVAPAVDEFRLGLSYLSEGVDSLQVLLVHDPFTPLEIDAGELDSLKEAIAELDTLLAGKEYDIGPDVENKTIKPLAIIQNMPGNGLYELLLDFYRAPDPSAYTFGGIFPAGPPSNIISYVEADAIMNDSDDENMFYDRLQVLETAWLNDLALDLADPDANFGL
ncbi:MAG: hypothetical protein JSW54_02665, partial [Fidelibacterota bacterium]